MNSGVKTLPCSLSVLLSIHEFIEITGQLMFMNTFHAFQFYLHSAPVGFRVLDVDSTRGDKLYGMVNRITLGRDAI